MLPALLAGGLRSKRRDGDEALDTLADMGLAVPRDIAGHQLRRHVICLVAQRSANDDASVALRSGPLPAQAEIVGVVNTLSQPRDVVVCAAGSLPGDLHKLWRTRDPKGYHVEYGYSCMGYEIAGGIGVKMAAPDREIFVMVGDGSYLMMNSELVTAI